MAPLALGIAGLTSWQKVLDSRLVAVVAAASCDVFYDLVRADFLGACSASTSGPQTASELSDRMRGETILGA